MSVSLEPGAEIVTVQSPRQHVAILVLVKPGIMAMTQTGKQAVLEAYS